MTERARMSTVDEILKWPSSRFLVEVADYGYTEWLLEHGNASCSQLEVIRSRLASSETAAAVMAALCKGGFLHLLSMALREWPELAASAVVFDSSTPLHLAARHCQPEAVQMLVKAGADTEAARVGDGWTALHEAAACVDRRSADIVLMLLRAGAKVDGRGGADKTPLQVAAMVGNASVTKVLCQTGVDVCAGLQGWCADSPLVLAADSGSRQTVAVLLEAGAAKTDTDGNTALHYAGENGRDETIMALVAAGLDVNLENSEGLTALHFAAEHCGEEAVKALLEAGADVRKSNRFGVCALQFAARRRNCSVLRSLLSGCDVNLFDEDGWTPLHRVARYSNEEAAIRQLLESGADRNTLTKVGNTALHLAAKGGNAEALRLLLDGSDCNLKGEGGLTPLHFVAQYTNNVEMATDLLLAGADKKAVTDWGDTALHLAARGGNINVLRLLLLGTDVNIKGRYEYTALHNAAKYTDNVEIIKMLLLAGADKEVAAGEGNIALHLAASRGNVDVLRLLLRGTTDVDVKGMCDWTPLHYAAMEGRLEAASAAAGGSR